MARDLKAGDPVRTLGGVAKVGVVEPGTVQPVYQPGRGRDADFFAGRPRRWSTTTRCPTSGAPRSTPRRPSPRSEQGSAPSPGYTEPIGRSPCSALLAALGCLALADAPAAPRRRPIQ